MTVEFNTPLEAEYRRPGVGSALVRWLLPFIGGLMVGAFGTAIHRTIYLTELFDADWWEGLPVGLIVGLALVLCAALLLRALGGLGSLLAFAAGLVLVVQVLSLAAPGGSVLILDPTQGGVRLPALGVIWAFASAGILILAMMLPRRWFSSADDEDDVLATPLVGPLSRGSSEDVLEMTDTP